jgi:hypothetical protein
MRIHSTALGLQPFDSEKMNGILRYTAAAERSWHRALTQLRAAQNDRLKRHASPVASQPEEAEKVMAIGSVSQNQPEPAETPAPVPESAPVPVVAVQSEPQDPALAGEDARRYAEEDEIMARRQRVNDFVAFAKKDLARMRG